MSPLSRSVRRPARPLVSAVGVVAVALLLAACGGSGGGSSTSATATVGTTTTAASAGALPAGASPNDWTLIGRDRDNSRYAPQTQITPENVAQLGEAWSADLGTKQALNESFPLVVDGVMYVTTSTDEVYAYNAATGQLKWKYVPKVDFSHSTGVGGYGIAVNRGVAVANGKVYLLTFDDNLKAISAATGEELFSTQVVDPKTHSYETMAPTVYDGKVYVGNSGSDQGVRGFVSAYDANTGKKLWRFYTVPAPGHGWNKDGKSSGGTVYMAPTIDTVTDSVIVGTGNPAPAIVGKSRPGNNLYTSSIISLNAQTGKLNWYNQQVKHDLWDYDAASPTLLYTATIDGKPVRAVAEAGKSGFFFMLDAKTGKDLFPKVPFVKQDHTPPTKKGTLECPGPLGGSTYAPLAYSPKTQAAYISGIEFCFILKVGKAANGESNFGGIRVIQPNVVPHGTFTAVNGSTGKVLWQNKMKHAMGGGAAATASNIVFTGDIHGNFFAFDAATGKTLWQKGLGESIGAAPIVYTVDGTEYVAIVTGGSGLTASDNLGVVGSRVVVMKLGGGAFTKPHTKKAPPPSS